MTATTAATAALRIFAEADSPDELVVLVFGDGATITANAYVRDIGAIEGHTAWTWACGADLAQYRFAGLVGAVDSFYTYGFETTVGTYAAMDARGDSEGHYAVFV